VQRLRWIEAGVFLMGVPNDEVGHFDNEGPQHVVTIGQGFWLADTACTQALWQAVMGGEPSVFRAKNHGGLNHPVEMVSWDDIARFLPELLACLPGAQGKYLATLPPGRGKFFSPHQSPPPHPKQRPSQTWHPTSQPWHASPDRLANLPRA
jgi:hypothetical protein